MPLFLAPLLCLSAALVFGAEARSTSAVAERFAFRCVDRFALLTILPACAASLILDAPWSLFGFAESPATALGVGLTTSALLSVGSSWIARVAARSNVSQGRLRALGLVACGLTGLVLAALAVARGARALLPSGGALAAVTAAFVLALVALSMILSLQAATQSRPDE